jgi:RHS repeat-associated protein
LMAGYSYDETGAKRVEYLHSENNGAFLQRNNYKYNIRGWLTEINNPSSFTDNSKFGLRLYYNGGPSPCPTLYNGNIAGMLWGTPNHSSMYYVYTYDANNRLTQANFNKSGMSATALDVSYTYDLNGNIQTLNRYGFTGTYIDQLTYTYNGNWVIGLSDASGDIAGVVDYPGSPSTIGLSYDNNGNLNMETHKLIETGYNLLNLPKELIWLGQNRRINYYYNFDGAKLRKRVENNGTLTKVDYCGPYVYETASGVRSLKYLVTPYGRAVKNGSTWDFEYNLTDHLGNVRAVIRKGSNNLAELIQQKHYYPFGMEISNISPGTGTNKYLYNGKEIQDDFSLYWYDYGARFYDPQLGRWHSVDPLAEDIPSWTPYHYCHNNPIVLIDPDGRSADWYQSESGALLWKDENKQQITVNGEQFKNVGRSASIGTGDGNYINYYQNVPVSISNAQVNAQKTVLNNDGLKGQLLSRNSPLSEKSQVGLMTASIHKWQQDFINHPVTKATVNTLLFVATGGIEGAVSLASGAKSVFNVAKSSQASDWIRTGKTVVSNQIVKGQGTPGATVTWGVKGRGNLAKTGESMGFHYHIHKYNWYNPASWFKQTLIIKPPKP